MSVLHILCKIDGAEYAIPAADVYQMEAYVKVTPVPGAPSYVIGLIHLRQQVVPVIDARLRLGLPAIAPTPDSRFVVLRFGQRLVGILVDSARELGHFAPEQFQVAPDVIANEQNRFIKSIAQLRDRIVLLIDTQKMIGEENSHGPQ